MAVRQGRPSPGPSVTGLPDGPQSIRVDGIDAERGLVFLEVGDRPAEAEPGLAPAPFVVSTAVSDGLVTATAVCRGIEAGSTDGMAVAGIQSESGLRSSDRERGA